MIGLIFATRFEARPFLSLTSAQQVSERPFKIFAARKPSELIIIVSGIGKINAALATQVLIRDHGVEYIVNAGACGALHEGRDELAIGRLVRVASAVEGDHSLFDKPLVPLPSAERIALNLPRATLVTTDKPIFDTPSRIGLAEIGDVVDMEGAAIARAAGLYGVAWDMVKGVSDACVPIDHDQLRANITVVCESIARSLWDEIH